MNQHKQLFERLAAAAFWLAVWQAAAMAIGQEVFLVSPVQALRCLLRLLPRPETSVSVLVPYADLQTGIRSVLTLSLIHI